MNQRQEDFFLIFDLFCLAPAYCFWQER